MQCWYTCLASVDGETVKGQVTYCSYSVTFKRIFSRWVLCLFSPLYQLLTGPDGHAKLSSQKKELKDFLQTHKENGILALIIAFSISSKCISILQTSHKTLESKYQNWQLASKACLRLLILELTVVLYICGVLKVLAKMNCLSNENNMERSY